jgi:hypothetical protein
MLRFKYFVWNMYGPTLMSRCTIFCWCKYWIACTNWKKISFKCDSCSGLPGRTRVERSPPSMNSSTMKREESVSTTLSVWITQGWQHRNCILCFVDCASWYISVMKTNFSFQLTVFWPTDSQKAQHELVVVYIYIIHLLTMGYKYAWKMYRLTDEINWG